ncbi:hypothetical protein L9F63_003863 [Diploptera punctata]|uniref:Immunoglobulin-binding protein 1 n=1 Tax=Diploptera punctata TaxID=6984 RepID=A0AAD7ZJF1_DIPPU|nr:hypothetical protein L9F63_003863 [Diploptera punctata]
MAASSEELENKKLSEIFDEGMIMFEDIAKTSEATNSNNIQVLIRKAMRLFEDATRLVSISGMFSSNETIDEVPTKNIRYLLLPAILGTLTLKLSVKDRMNVVQTAEIYFRDYLTRCKNYEVIDFEIPEPKENEAGNTPGASCSEMSVVEENESRHASGHLCAGTSDLAAMAVQRNLKIKRYKEKKELENQLDDLKKSLNQMEITDEEIERKYYLTLIKNYASEALDEINSLEMEKPILEHIAKVRKGENFADSIDESKKLKRPPKPLQPIIITKDELQKKVFGAGYPSLPTMTVQEFYEKRIRDGDWPDPSKQKPQSLQDMAQIGMTEQEKEREEIDKEEKTERDDPKCLQQARDWDEFKDEHRRGWGNRMNRS